MNPSDTYEVNNDYIFSELLEHFDLEYIFSVLYDKINNFNYTSSLIEPNIINAFESNFRRMFDELPGDGDNIKSIRDQTYRITIDILTKKFNITFNTEDENIDLYTAAAYLYEFLICRRNEIMVNFFVSFIINNKESLYTALINDGFKKMRDISSNYSRRVYIDQKIVLITAGMNKVLNYIGEMDVKLVNIFQSTYIDPKVVQFLDNAFSDNANFFKDQYMSVLNNPEISPIIITDIKISLQKIVGNTNLNDISDVLDMANN